MIKELSSADLKSILSTNPNSIFLLDVRELSERAETKIDGDSHIPMNEIAERIQEIPKDKDVVVYCHLGGRSMRVCQYLESQGYETVTNLAGGIVDFIK